jgi:hypothetical protein
VLRNVPPDGLDYEICFGSGDADLGIDPGQPEGVEVHNIIKQ